LSLIRARRRMPAVSHSVILWPRPVPVDRDGIPGDAGLGPGEQALRADQAVDQGRLPGIGAGPTIAASRSGRSTTACAASSSASSPSSAAHSPPRLADEGFERLVERIKTLAMRRRQRDRSPKPSFIGFEPPRLAAEASDCWR
jgi:hypothetical protein